MEKQKKVRLTVSVDAEIYEKLCEIKKISGGTLAGHLSSFISELSPILDFTLSNIKIIKSLDEQSKKKLKQSFNEIENDMNELGERAKILATDAASQMSIFEAILRQEKRDTLLDK